MSKFNYHSHRQRCWRDYEVYIKRLSGTPGPLLDMGSGIGLLTPSELENLLKSVGFINCNMVFNRPQNIPEIPPVVLDSIWSKYRPDLLAKSATVLAHKPE